jgi:hypothetical protein
MDWEVEFISLYLFVYKHYQNNLSNYCQRMSNYTNLKFSGEEAITHYLYGVVGLTDSMPIIMAKRDRRFHAKVAPEIATKKWLLCN